ncbi:30S ribosome-binding factor RbfA [Desulfobotulus sp.]|jgi:ribosome-binding factor A|uniref:30S ribosome-binding factor RbfA n=1 Tax=Desulfobotulus sp. TaxID=1940337 RepID=UPI002A363C05|nr:30S ribosome-binding factor RbfA [Desulfobotulus sp.]MDY0163703.1 30S ribosome-binding factor RbfA [Desulfobotulus sp.]
MKASPRSDRIRGRIREVISTHLARNVQDPRLHLVTVTAVELSRDLRIATVFFTTAGGPEAQANALRGFESAKGFLKRNAAKDLGLRYMPDLRFRHDDSFDYGARMEKIFRTITPSQTPSESKEGPDDAEHT